MDIRHVFITGGSGCIGHYVLEALMAAYPQYIFHVLYRDKSRFKIDVSGCKNIVLHQGSMETIHTCKDTLANMDYLIHIATEWGDYEHTVHINVDKTKEMLSYLDPQKCKRILYFSTASILGPNNRPTVAAKTYGTPYVRSKYLAYHMIQQLPISSKIVTLFPTTVFGGDKTHPLSHLTKGIPESSRYIKILKWIYFDAAFHFLHAKDIATVTVAALTCLDPPSNIVLGNPVVSERDAITVLSKVFQQKIWFQLRVPTWFVLLLTRLFRVQLAPWDKHCIQNPRFEYNTMNPRDFDQPVCYESFESVVQDALVQSADKNCCV